MNRALMVVLMVLAGLPAWAQGPAVGQRFRLSPIDLPAPNATPSAANPAHMVARPDGATVTVPPEWTAGLFAAGLDHPRNLLALPDGSVLVAEQRADRLVLLQDADSDGVSDRKVTFATGFAEPFGLAFHDGAVWVADTQAVWRLAWQPGQEREIERVRVTPKGALGDDRGHSTRSLAVHPDGTRLYVGIGSRANIAEEAEPRATIREFRLDGTGGRTFASGLRNPVGLAFRPGTDELWTVVNERDGMGDGLVPDYLTRVEAGAFYGWPYAYIGPHRQPGLADKAMDKVVRTRLPEVLFQAHSAPLGLAFSGGFAYVALHGSWNRSIPVASMVVRVPMVNGQPLGDYEVFATGFMTSDTSAWGRPVGLALDASGALLVADDAGGTVWRIAPKKP